MSKLQPTSIRLTSSLKDKLKVEAARKKWGLSKLIQEILIGYIKRRKGEQL